ncbi:unnamed protein product [Alternaria alternata]
MVLCVESDRGRRQVSSIEQEVVWLNQCAHGIETAFLDDVSTYHTVSRRRKSHTDQVLLNLSSPEEKK